MIEAYLDIETTGLDFWDDKITLIGILLVDTEVLQKYIQKGFSLSKAIEEDLRYSWERKKSAYPFSKMIEIEFYDYLDDKKFHRIITGVDKIYTYNGKNFDLPFILGRIGAGWWEWEYIKEKHIDLMDYCHREGIKGGQKKAERFFGFWRRNKDENGAMAVELWRKGEIEKLKLYNLRDLFGIWAIKLGLQTKYGYFKEKETETEG